MSNWSYEPTIGELMREPMVRALMKADRVNARQFETRLRMIAGETPLPDEAEASDEDADVSYRRFPAPIAHIAKTVVDRCCRC